VFTIKAAAGWKSNRFPWLPGDVTRQKNTPKLLAAPSFC